MNGHGRPTWRTKISLLLFGLFISFIGVEILVRVSGLDRPALWHPDAEVGWVHIPGTRLHWREEGDGQVLINSQGLRDEERSVQKPGGTYRIAVFGDSMTEAVQVNLDQTFAQLLQKRLRDRGMAVEVVNFGVSGYSPLQEYLLYKKLGRSFTPDLVIHAVFTDNDVSASDPAIATGQVGAPFLRPGNVDQFDVDYSRSLQSVRDYAREPNFTMRRWLATYRLMGAIRRTRAGNDEFQAKVVERGGIPTRYQLYLDPVSDQWNEAWKTFERILTRFASDVRSDGARFVVLSMPAGQVVNSSAWARVLEQFPAMKERAWKLEEPEARLQRIAQSLQVEELRPLETFKAAPDKDSLFFGGVGHLTPRGHQVLTDYLEEALLRLSLVPSSR
jgi:hypothetical protein